MPKRLLVAREPKSLGPKENRSGRQGRRRTAVNQWGTRLEIRILQQVDDDAEEAEDAAGGD